MPKYRIRVCPEIGMSLDAVTQRFSFLGRTGSGKTFSAGVLVEEFLKAKQQVCIIDPQGGWKGLRSSADGKKPGFSILILGGSDGDMPLEPTSGALVADMVAQDGLSMIIDLSLFDTDADEIRFMTDFADRLFRKNRHPMHLVIDEADTFMPQSPMREENRLLNRMARIAKRGRFKGIGMSLVSQRSAAISKRCLSQTEIMVALQTTDPRDKRAIAEWVEDHAEGDKESEKDMVIASLSKLDKGEAWVWSPSFLKILKKTKFRMKETYDSSATPKPGQRRRAPKSLASVDLELMKKRMAATIEKQKQDDPKLLREKIVGLEKALATEKRRAQLQLPGPAKEVVKTVEVVRQGRTKTVIKYVPLIKKRDIARLEKVVNKGFKIKDQLGFVGQKYEMIARNMWNEVKGIFDKIQETPEDRARDEDYRKKLLMSLAKNEEGSEIVAGPRPKAKPITINARPVHRHNRVEELPEAVETTESGEVVIKAGARRMLQALASMGEDGLTKRQLATLVGMKLKGGTCGQYLSAIRRSGNAEEQSGKMFITKMGLEYLDGDFEKKPKSLEEVLQLWRKSLKAGAFKLVEYLVSIHPKAVTREELALACDFDEAGGTYGQYVSTIVRNNVVDKIEEDETTKYRASSSLFIGEAVRT